MKGRRKLSPEERADICRRYQAGQKVAEIYVIHGISSSTLGKTLQRAGLPLRDANATRSAQFSWPPERLQLAISLHVAGHTSSEIGAKLNVDRSTVSKRLRDAEVANPGCTVPAGRIDRQQRKHTVYRVVTGGYDWTDAKLDEMKRLMAAGLSATQIAEKFGTTKSSVLGKSRRLGIVWPERIRTQGHSPAPVKPKVQRVIVSDAINGKTISLPDPAASANAISMTYAALIQLAQPVGFYHPTRGIDLAGWNAERARAGRPPFAIRKSQERVRGRLEFHADRFGA